MRVSTYIVILLLTCCLAGLGLLAGYSSFDRAVEHARERVSTYELAQEELSRLSDCVRYWFLVTDLFSGQGHEALLAGERDLRARVTGQLDALRCSPLGSAVSGNLARVTELVDSQKARLASTAATGPRRPDQVEKLVARLGGGFAPVATNLSLMEDVLGARIAEARASHAEELSRRATATWSMAVLFVCGILALWLWTSRTITAPLKLLSEEVRKVTRDSGEIARMASGPDEVVHLSEVFCDLVDRMDARVRERTQHLATANRELNIARLQAEAASEAKSDFLTNVSHELRTPLASIRASAEILQTYPDESQEVKLEFAEVIQQEAERLSRLIDDVLDLGKIEAGRMDWKEDTVQIAEILSEVVRVANVDRGRNGVEVTLEVQGELPWTVADRDRLMQLWTNLVGNAVKFTPRGKEVEVVAWTRADSIVVEVRDEGPGIRREDQKAIFERFMQVTDDSLTAKPHGTGLGLAIVKEIADHHNANIVVDSEPGLGSVFRVVLPVVSEAVVAALRID